MTEHRAGRYLRDKFHQIAQRLRMCLGCREIRLVPFLQHHQVCVLCLEGSEIFSWEPMAARSLDRATRG